MIVLLVFFHKFFIDLTDAVYSYLLFELIRVVFKLTDFLF